jgi:hypothetical protein
MAKRKVKIPSTPGGLHGWHADKSAQSRRRILDRLVKKDGYATVVRRLNLLRIWNKNKKQDAAYKAATADWQYLQKKYRSGGKETVRKAANPINKHEVSAIRGSWALYERGLEGSIKNLTINSEAIESYNTLRGMLTTLKDMRGERAQELYREKRDAFDSLVAKLKKAAPGMDVRNSSYRSVRANPKRRAKKNPDYSGMQIIYRDGSIALNFAEAEKKAKKMTDSALRYAIRDAEAATKAQPQGRKAGYYMDEVHVYARELGRRRAGMPARRGRLMRNPVSMAEGRNVLSIIRKETETINDALSQGDISRAQRAHTKMEGVLLALSKIEGPEAKELLQEGFARWERIGDRLDRRSRVAGNPGRRKGRNARKLTEKQLDRAIGTAWHRLMSGVQVPILDIPKIYRDVKAQVREGMSVEDAVLAVGPKYRVNPGSNRKGKKGSNSSQAFDVYLGRKLIDTVFYSKSAQVTTDEVRRSLIDHDGYDPGIRVVKRRESRKNPLLMTVTANPHGDEHRMLHDDPDIGFRRRANRDGRPVRINKPKTRRKQRGAQEVPFKDFYKWAKKNLETKELKRLDEEIAGYRRFHKSMPNTVKREVIDIGPDDVVMRDFAYSMGKSPTETYIAPSGSHKQGPTWLHENANGNESGMPDVITNRKGKYTLKPLKGKSRITDWMHD